jgi:hypothetical protein
MVKEKGATQRQGMAGDAAVAQANIQAAAAKQMQDAKMAEAERGRREDQEFRLTMEEIANKNAMRRDTALAGLADAREQKRLDLIEKWGKDLDATARADKLNAQTKDDNDRNVTLSVGEATSQSETAIQKNSSTRRDALTKHKAMREIGRTTVEDVVLELARPEFVYDPKEMPSGAGKYAKAALTHGVSPVAWVIPGVTRKGVKGDIAKSANDAKVSTSVDRLLGNNGVANVTLDTIIENDGRKLEEMVSKREVTAENIPAIRAVLETTRKAFAKKAATARENKQDNEADFYTDWVGKLRQANESVRGLKKSQMKMEGDNTFTVGAEMTRGNNWSGEWDPTEFEIEEERIRNELQMTIQEIKRESGNNLGIATTSSPRLTPSDKANKILMSLLAENEQTAAGKMPQIYGGGDMGIDIAGELGGY